MISELESYSYPDRKPEKNEPELPIKEHDHACDALRYALAPLIRNNSGFNALLAFYQNAAKEDGQQAQTLAQRPGVRVHDLYGHLDGDK